MFTRARIAAASAGAGLLLAGYVAGSALGQAPAFAQATGSALEQVAQVPPQPSPQPGPRDANRPPKRWDPQQRQQMREQYLNRLAANLGIDRDRLVQALRQTRIDMVNEALRAGRITQERANRIIDRINSGQQSGPRRSTNP